MIVVAGDSYCAQIDEGTWPSILSKNLDMPIKQYSNSGGSWWATRRKLVKAKQAGEFDNAKVVVLCHTEGSRIPNVDDFSIGGWAVENRPAWYQPKVLLAAKMYYEHLHDPDFGTWTQQAWLNECVDLFPKDAIVVHLHSFPYSYLKLVVTNGVNFFPPLFAITQAEFSSDEEGFNFIEKTGDSRKNHFNEENNLALGHEITKIIKDGITKGEYKADLSKFYIKNIETIKQHSTGSGDIMYNGKPI
jgi:hypothetical protein